MLHGHIFKGDKIDQAAIILNCILFCIEALAAICYYYHMTVEDLNAAVQDNLRFHFHGVPI